MGPLARRVHEWLTELFEYRCEQLRADLDLHTQLDAAPATVAVTGASGLIGSQVVALLGTGGHRVVRLVRGRAEGPDEISWDPRGSLDPSALSGVDAVAHLAGAPIAGRFTPAHKNEVLNSRLHSTATLCRAIREAADPPRVLVQASAIGYYGPRRPGEVLTEDSGSGPGFLADVVRRWEAATEVGPHTRTVWLRTGVVLTAAGGALAPQLPMFRLGIGGRLTDPDARQSWIGLDDMARAYVWALFSDAEGPYNAVATHPVTAERMARTLGRVLNRPAALPVPGAGPSLVLGRQGADEIIETDQCVSSTRLEEAGFVMTQPELEPALRHLLLRRHR